MKFKFKTPTPEEIEEQRKQLRLQRELLIADFEFYKLCLRDLIVGYFYDPKMGFFETLVMEFKTNFVACVICTAIGLSGCFITLGLINV